MDGECLRLGVSLALCIGEDGNLDRKEGIGARKEGLKQGISARRKKSLIATPRPKKEQNKTSVVK
jgi:hypothetical protein